MFLMHYLLSFFGWVNLGCFLMISDAILILILHGWKRILHFFNFYIFTFIEASWVLFILSFPFSFSQHLLGLLLFLYNVLILRDQTINSSCSNIQKFLSECFEIVETYFIFSSQMDGTLLFLLLSSGCYLP